VAQRSARRQQGSGVWPKAADLGSAQPRPLEGVLQVLLDCVLRDEEPLEDLAVGEPAHHQPEYLFFTWAEARGGDVEPGDLLWFGGSDDDHRLAWTVE
jgi:hypothetical protein